MIVFLIKIQHFKNEALFEDLPDHVASMVECGSIPSIHI